MLLQLNHILFILFRRKLAGVVFKDGLYGLIRGGVKENDRRDVFSKRFAMLVICWVKTHTLMPLWRALKPRQTSWLVRPFASFKAAQSSRMISVFLASKKKLASLRKPSTSCCKQLITKMRGSLSTKLS